MLALALGVFSTQPAMSQGHANQWQEEPYESERHQRVFGASWAMVWNGLNGFGPLFHLYPLPHVALDAGAGIGFSGVKTGIGARAMFLRHRFTPFAGIGFSRASGGEASIEGNQNRAQLDYRVEPSPNLQFSVGFDLQARNGFLLLISGGYNKFMASRSVTVLSGTPTDDDLRMFDAMYGSGGIFGICVGKAF